MWVHFLNSVGCKFKQPAAGIVSWWRSPSADATRAGHDRSRARRAVSLLDAMGLPTDITEGLNIQG